MTSDEPITARIPKKNSDIIYFYSLDGKFDKLRNGFENMEKYNLSKTDFERCVSSAAFRGHTDIVKYLVENGVTVDTYSLYGACRNNHFDIVKYLVEKGVDVNNVIRPLEQACETNNLEMVKYLVENGADVHSNPDSLCYHASKSSNPQIMKYLVEELGIDLTHIDKEEILHSIWHEYDPQGFRVLAQHIEFTKEQINECFMSELWCEDTWQISVNVLKYLIELGADAHITDGVVICNAIYYDINFEVVKFLVENGANPEFFPVAIRMTRKNYPEIAEYLRKHLPYSISEHDCSKKFYVSFDGSKTYVK